MAKQKKSSKIDAKSTRSKGVPTPHDHFFRYTFLQRDHALEFLQNYLPEELLPLLKLDELALESGTYIDERLAEHLSDILYEVPLSQAKSDDVVASIYMLFEHKSLPEQQVLLQLLRYMYECWVADLKDGKAIRPIVPIVFYHGARNWNIPTRFIESFEEVDKLFYAFIPDFSYILFDASNYEAEQIKQAISSGPLQASLLLLKYIYDQGLDTKLADVFDPLAKSELPREHILAHLKAMLKYISETSNPVDEQKLTETVRDKFVNEEGAMNVLADVWREEGRVKGLEEGLLIGREEGHEEGHEEGLEKGLEKGLEEGRCQKQRETLRLLLEHRFIKRVTTDTEADEQEEDQSDTLEFVQEKIAEIVRRLEYVKTESELDVLTDFLLFGADLVRFIDHLPPEPSEADIFIDEPSLDAVGQDATERDAPERDVPEQRITEQEDLQADSDDVEHEQNIK